MHYKQKDFTKLDLGTSHHKALKKAKQSEKDIIIFSEDFQGDIYSTKFPEKVSGK